ncbi:MAG: hypothetical protein UV54_C0008G0006 [Candidatus Beckwithbacteria bacterium GW2011_GWA2_43_10]|uniref:Iron-binding zinc finger CDGSH type domain-containing protein n=1 Tax=Candidatus Beckwithbacteria bacterium GW2011_GWA2_43_10 TaxID=1618369 RepID=A0A0G1EBD4_9BACT|nr:MAG: hypothetical protein UV54_C0008G0006 [Candidatus Beckwithbacteria bacterium GW2011_GWA2_43_10]
MAAKIKALINGPYQVSGGVTVEDATGKTIVAEKDVWLCRCGASKNKPFCDGAHAKIGFKADNKNSKNPIMELAGIEKSKTGKMGLNVDEIYNND